MAIRANRRRRKRIRLSSWTGRLIFESQYPDEVPALPTSVAPPGHTAPTQGNREMSKNLMEFAKEYSGAWAAHDPAAIAAMHTDDSVFELHDVGALAIGRAAVRELIEALRSEEHTSELQSP